MGKEQERTKEQTEHSGTEDKMVSIQAHSGTQNPVYTQSCTVHVDAHASVHYTKTCKLMC